MNVAILGYGTVGSGVLEVINKNKLSIQARAGEEIRVKKILDIRDFPDSPDQDILTKHAEDVFEDDTIKIVVETIGGAKIAYEFTKRALKTGKHVVTSNKELVATHGPELLQLALDHQVSYLFEASVGGGIPIIRPLHQCLAANELTSITGILNGTTNYILSQMKREGKDFGEALREAQQKGYAEADPTADVEGHDACRKIAILSSIAYNEYVDYHGIPTEGISKITLRDMQVAYAMNATIKLIGMSKRVGDKIFARVCPVIIGLSNPLANVEDVFNAIVVSGNAIGDAMFYGRGAGKLPTASAVVADIIDIVKHPDQNISGLWHVRSTHNMVDADEIEAKFLIRINGCEEKELERAVVKVFGAVTWVRLPEDPVSKETVFVTETQSENQLKQRLEVLKSEVTGIEISNIIRVI